MLAQGAEDVVAALQSGALSMKSFLHDHLPGAKGHATTLALYLQGCRFHKASQRQVPLRLGAACVRVCVCAAAARGSRRLPCACGGGWWLVFVWWWLVFVWWWLVFVW